MTQEEKNILLKDLCGRLIYELKGLHRGEVQRLLIMDSFGSYQVNGYAAWFNLDTVPFKPYLRPMSSMTEEEKDELINLRKEMNMHMHPWIDRILDFYLSHHLDWRGLILLGLAIEAPEGMYKTE